jgi:hypothetical protein
MSICKAYRTKNIEVSPSKSSIAYSSLQDIHDDLPIDVMIDNRSIDITEIPLALPVPKGSHSPQQIGHLTVFSKKWCPPGI